MHDPALKRLEDARLYGAGLVRVDTPQLVGRYNESLKSLGIEGTNLDSFSVDGVGWSPEIALEKENAFYLCHGIANPLGVIISPDQEKKPIYVPFNSYDWRLMRAYFERHAKTVADITITTAITLEFDMDLAIIEDPFDFLLVDFIVVRSQAGILIDAAQEQKDFVRRFREPMGWFDASLRARIIESSSQYGDLRYRQAQILDFRFDDLRSFHTRMFGGMYVFRCGQGPEERDFLVVENRELYEREGRKEREHVYSMHEQMLIDRLFEEELIDIDVEWYRSNPQALHKRWEHVVIDTLFNHDPHVNYLALTTGQRKRRIVTLKGELPSLYGELERFSKRLTQGKIRSRTTLSPALQLLLARPRHDLRESLKDVLWNLICKLQTVPDVLQLYKADKDEFFRQYRTWPEGKKEWSVKTILEHYVPSMNE